MGILGGFTGLIWSSLDLTLGGYESFKFTSSLISEIYPIQKPKEAPQNIDEASADMINVLQ